MFPCTQCCKKFKYKSELVRHEKSHSRPFECSVCDKKFSFQSALHRHEKQHHRTGSVSCDKCGHTFRDNVLLKRHMKYAHDGTHTCEKCLSVFHSVTALQAHIRIHKPESERKFRCHFDGCGKSFNFSHHLKNHELTHTNTKRYFCKFCGKGFIQGHHLKIHLKTHEANWFYCEENGCNKKFLTRSAKEKHYASHGASTVYEPVYSEPHYTLSEISEHATETKDIRITIEHEVESINYNNTLVISTGGPVVAEDVSYVPAQLNDNTCKSILGRCIVTESTDSDEHCLCSQINSSSSQNLFNTIEDPKEPVQMLSNMKSMECDLSDLSIKTDVCGECACFKTCMKVNLDKVSLTPPEVSDVPEVTFENNGTITLKETFDSSILIQGSLQEDSVDRHIPMNSCKAVLGKCIVSGNGTMGAECLCAKMMNDGNVNSEEIEELTLVPIQF